MKVKAIADQESGEIKHEDMGRDQNKLHHSTGYSRRRNLMLLNMSSQIWESMLQ